MSTMEEKINSGVETKGIALMTHLVVGYPSIDMNKKLLAQMESAGVELVEFQFPFSEPVADGPLFAMANQSSIDSGTTIDQCFELVKWASEKYSFKILMMGYYNTVFKRGEQNFIDQLGKMGGVGVIVPDIPLEESVEFRSICAKTDVEFIHLITPSTSNKRLLALATQINQGQSFTYVVARKGTTGKATDFSTDMDDYLAKIKKNVKKPIGVGFGIASRDDVQFLKGKADMAIIGSKVLKIVEEEGVEKVGPFLSSLR